jgi:hypothetical protein
MITQTTLSTASLDFAKPGNQTVAIVRVASPWYAPNWLIAGQFPRYVSEYEKLDGLARKLYTIGADRHYGGIYLWSTRKAAQAYYSPQWAEGIRQRRGSAPDLRLWQAPFVLEGPAQLSLKPVGDRSGSTAACATLTLITPRAPSQPASQALEQLAGLLDNPSGLVRSYLLSAEDGGIGMVNLWASRSQACAFFSEDRIKTIQAKLGVLRQETYSVPMLMEPAARG